MCSRAEGIIATLVQPLLPRNSAATLIIEALHYCAHSGQAAMTMNFDLFIRPPANHKLFARWPAPASEDNTL
jgi:hypothetical protein